MATGKLKSLVVTGLGNKIFRIEDGKVLTDKMFPPGRFNELVAAGHIELLPELSAVPAGESTPPPPPGEPAAPAAPTEKNPNAPLAFDKISYIELKEWMKQRDIEFKANESRANLYKLYTTNFTAPAPAEPVVNPEAPGKLPEKPQGPAAYDDINVAQLEQYLTDKQVAFDAEADKQALYDIYIGTFNIE